MLIRDTIPLKILDTKRVMTEGIGGKKIPTMRLTGVFQRADQKNSNGRVYPAPVLKEAVNSCQEAINGRRVFGEFDHPPDAKIHMDRVSHLLTKLWMEGKTVYGEIEVINDDRCPLGSLLSCFVDRGMQVGISSRGVGDMEVVVSEGEEAYQVLPGFSFVTFDAVAEPSVEGTQLIVAESKIITGRETNSKLLREELLLREFRSFLFD